MERSIGRGTPSRLHTFEVHPDSLAQCLGHLHDVPGLHLQVQDALDAEHAGQGRGVKEGHGEGWRDRLGALVAQEGDGDELGDKFKTCGHNPKVVGEKPRVCLAGDSCSGSQSVIAAKTAPVAAARSLGAKFTERPRRPPETRTASASCTEASMTVGRRRFCPSGDIPPTT